MDSCSVQPLESVLLRYDTPTSAKRHHCLARHIAQEAFNHLGSSKREGLEASLAMSNQHLSAHKAAAGRLESKDVQGART